MPRGPRQQAPDVVYHVMVRGVERRRIFLDDRDLEFLLARLTERIREDRASCFAWVFMPNHVHLVIRVGASSLSKLMQRLLTSYALYFNRRHDRVGHLVQNRFKSLLVLDEEYLLPLIRYVHRNPLTAGLVRSLEELASYRWSGYSALIGRRPARFEELGEVLARFDPDPAVARRRIADWMRAEGESAPLDEWYSGSVSAPPGDSNPVRSWQTTADTECVSLEGLVRDVCRELDVELTALRDGRRRDRKTSRARSLIAYRATCELGFSGSSVARVLGVSRAAVVQAAQRGRRLAGLPRSAATS